MTYQEYEWPRVNADLIALIQDGEVVKCFPVPWLNEEKGDMAVLFRSRATPDQYRWAAIKVIGHNNPWGAYHIVEKWVATFPDTVECHMLHTIIDRFGRY